MYIIDKVLHRKYYFRTSSTMNAIAILFLACVVVASAIVRN